MTDLSEARFTKPRPECPYPERWTSDDSDSTEHQVTALVAAFVTALQPDLVIETGTAFGQTAEAVGRALRQNGRGRLVTLEPDPGRARISRERCRGLPVEVRQESSLDYTPDGPVDLAWFDSLFELRPLELRRYRRWMHPRTVVGFHDTGTHHPVLPLLRDLERDGLLLSPLFLPTPRGVCFARVM